MADPFSFHKWPKVSAMVPASLGIMQCLLIFCPELVETFPYFPLGPVSAYFYANQPDLLRNLSYIIIVAHVLEGLAALFLCWKKKMKPTASLKWLASVTLFGVFSLHSLISYNPSDKKKKKQKKR